MENHTDIFETARRYVQYLERELVSTRCDVSSLQRDFDNVVQQRDAYKALLVAMRQDWQVGHWHDDIDEVLG
jgi:hypothetical protein